MNSRPAHSREHARFLPSQTSFPSASTHASEPQFTPGNPSEYPRQTIPFPTSQQYVYPSPRYFPLPSRPPYNFSDVPGSDMSSYQAQYPPVPVHHLATSNTVPYQAGSYDMQHYPSLYGPTEYFAFPSQYQPDAYHWYYTPAPPTDAHNQSGPIHVQQSHHVNYSGPRAHRLHRNSNASSSVSDHNNITASPNARLFASAHPPRQVSSRDLPNSEIREPGDWSAVTTTLPHDRPLVRRSYHPNPPPNRSEWVMWVGNVPSDATQGELWQFLKQSFPEDGGGVGDSGVLSVFLISRSNCAFVNYRSELYLNRAIAQFNGCPLRPLDHRCPRLLCRARRKDDDLRAGVGAQRGIGLHTSYVKNALQNVDGERVEKQTTPQGHSSVSITTVDPQPVPWPSTADEITNTDTVENKVPTQSPSSYASTNSSFLARHFPIRFFILKSLTRHDLDLSVERGVWATQKHNESILDQAFRTSKEVLLIFSVNKSGEFFGYARMASTILRSNQSVSWARRSDHSRSASSPTSSHALSPCDTASQNLWRNSPLSDRPLAESTASQAIQDTDLPSTQRHESNSSHALRGGNDTDDPGHVSRQLQSVIKEVHGNGVEEDIQPASMVPLEPLGMENEADIEQREGEWGKTFKVDWRRTERVPFHRTRHLRNPWNHGREIKVSRDGTEIEPTVGRRLIDEWQILSEGDVGNPRRPPRSGGRRNSRPVTRPNLSTEASKGVMTTH